MAAHLGKADVDGMLARLAPRQFYEWILYSHMEPFGEPREDYRIASLSSLIANIVRDREKSPEPFKIEDFVLSFADDPPKKAKRTQTWQDQKRIAQDMVKLYNTIYEKKAARQAAAKSAKADRGNLS